MSRPRSRRADIILYYGMQIGVLAVPFLLVPFFGRVLGAEGLGLLSQGQSLAAMVTAVVEYGFQISGTRQVAAHHDDPQALAGVASRILSAKLLLALLAVAAIPVAYVGMPVFHTHPSILVPAVMLGIAQGMSFYWLFGGMQRYFLAGSLDLGAKAVAAAAVFAVVRGPGDAWLALTIFAAAQVGAVMLGTTFYLHLLPKASLGLSKAKSALHEGRHIFSVHIVGTFYSGANPLLLGLVAPAQAVGVFSGGEKLVRAALMPLGPFRQVFYPIVAGRIAAAPIEGEALLRRLFAFTVPIAIFGSILLIFFAAPIVRLALGAGLSDSDAVVKVMALLLPLSLGLDLISNFWMLSIHQDRLVTRVTFITCAIHVVLFLMMSSTLPPAVGAGLALVLTQTISLAIYLFTAWRHHPRRGGGHA